MVYFLCKAYDSDRQNCYFALSLPVRGAWIEIRPIALAASCRMSLPVRGAWIEISWAKEANKESIRSLPVRGAWIEIIRYSPMNSSKAVAPRAGSVD